MFAFAAGAYCALTYMAGFKFFNVKQSAKYSILFWVFSPVTVPVMLLLLMIAG